MKSSCDYKWITSRVETHGRGSEIWHVCESFTAAPKIMAFTSDSNTIIEVFQKSRFEAISVRVYFWHYFRYYGEGVVG